MSKLSHRQIAQLGRAALPCVMRAMADPEYLEARNAWSLQWLGMEYDKARAVPMEDLKFGLLKWLETVCSRREPDAVEEIDYKEANPC